LVLRETEYESADWMWLAMLNANRCHMLWERFL
jgi:hypothetical protein